MPMENDNMEDQNRGVRTSGPQVIAHSRFINSWKILEAELYTLSRPSIRSHVSILPPPNQPISSRWPHPLRHPRPSKILQIYLNQKWKQCKIR